jgi:sugar lactone lactonase YvrE
MPSPSRKDRGGDRAYALTTLVSGIALGESPRWHSGRLWFADWAAHEIVAVSAIGVRETVIPIAEQIPICIDWSPNGELLIVAGSTGALLRRHASGALAHLADLRPLSRHAWNEICVDARGNAYVNSINFAFPGGEFAPGILAVVTPEGRVREVARDLAFPNGMAITPDNGTLLVAESYANQISAFGISPNGDLGSRRVWAKLAGGAPDGICLDAEGALWYADVPSKRCVRVREGGEVLDTIPADRGCFSCALGGEDGRTLFITANDWRGPEHMLENGRSGLILAARVDVPRAKWRSLP